MRGDGIPRTYNDAVYQLVHRSNIPPKELADRLGIGLSTLYNAANPDMDEPQLCHKHIVPATNSTNNYAILDYFEQACGRVAFELPRPTGTFLEVSREVGCCVKDFGRLLEQVAKSLEDNGKVDDHEFPAIERAGRALIAHVAKLIQTAQREADR